MGLVITKTLSELNGGSLCFRPGEESGAVFSLRLRYTAGSGGFALKECSRPRLSFDTILVIDDDPAMCRSVIRMLQGAAKSIVPAGSVKQASELIASLSPELVISDLFLGDGLAADLFSAVPENIPFLILSGSSDAAELLSSYSRSALGIVEKPVDRNALFYAISECILRAAPEAKRLVNS